jgi:hypothetical protein
MPPCARLRALSTPLQSLQKRADPMLRGVKLWTTSPACGALLSPKKFARTLTAILRPDDSESMKNQLVAKAQLRWIRNRSVRVLHQGVASDAPFFMSDNARTMLTSCLGVVLVAVIPTGCGIRGHIFTSQSIPVACGQLGEIHLGGW